MLHKWCIWMFYDKGLRLSLHVCLFLCSGVSCLKELFNVLVTVKGHIYRREFILYSHKPFSLGTHYHRYMHNALLCLHISTSMSKTEWTARVICWVFLIIYQYWLSDLSISQSFPQGTLVLNVIHNRIPQHTINSRRKIEQTQSLNKINVHFKITF